MTSLHWHEEAKLNFTQFSSGRFEKGCHKRRRGLLVFLVSRLRFSSPTNPLHESRRHQEVSYHENVVLHPNPSGSGMFNFLQRFVYQKNFIVEEYQIESVIWNQSVPWVWPLDPIIKVDRVMLKWPTIDHWFECWQKSTLFLFESTNHGLWEQWSFKWWVFAAYLIILTENDRVTFSLWHSRVLYNLIARFCDNHRTKSFNRYFGSKAHLEHLRQCSRERYIAIITMYEWLGKWTE